MIPVLREDLHIKPVEIGPDGYWIYHIFDPVSEEYYKISQQFYEIIKSGFSLEYDESRIQDVIQFLQTNSLLKGRPPETGKKSTFSKFFNALIYFRLPLVNPDRFLDTSQFLGKMIFNKYTVSVLSLCALLGFLSLLNGYESFAAGISGLMEPAALRIFIPVIIIIKIIHELSHAYTAKVLGCRVRSLGIAVIFLIPRFFTDISDMVETTRISRVKIALAGIWAEFIIGGLACFVFISSPSFSLSSQVSISFITVSLLSSLLFNGNPLMRFDGYYVLKELLGRDNLYSHSSAAVKVFWRKFLVGLKSETKIDTVTLVYGHLSLFYRMFIYSSISIFIYHFFIPEIGVVLAFLGIWIFLIRPVYLEAKYLFRMRRKISIFHKVKSVILVGLLFGLLFVEIPITSIYPAYCYIPKIPVRTDMSGEVIDMDQSRILLSNPELELKVSLLENELQLIRLRKAQALSEKNPASLKLLQETEKRLQRSLDIEKGKISKLTIYLPEKFQELSREPLLGSYLSAGERVGEVPLKPEFRVYFDSDIKELPLEGEIYFGNSFQSYGCTLNGEKTVSRTVPEMMSSSYDGPISVDEKGALIKPMVFTVSYVLDSSMTMSRRATYISFRQVSVFDKVFNPLSVGYTIFYLIDSKNEARLMDTNTRCLNLIQ